MQEVPLMSSFLMTCNAERQVEDREWLLRLLNAGMRGPADGDLCRSDSAQDAQDANNLGNKLDAVI